MIAPFPTPQARRRPVETAERVIAPSAFEYAYLIADRWQIAALEYYRMGLNVFPIEKQTKDRPFGQWRRMQTTRVIDPDAGDEQHETFMRLFENVNLAILLGRTSLNLTVLDCESENSAELHHKEFERRGLKPWVSETGRGFHFWFLSAEGEIKNLPDDKNSPRGWEIRGHSLYVLAAPSVHPTGAVYTWQHREGAAPPVISITALDWLPIELNIKPLAKFTPREFDPLAKLSKPNRDFCLAGASDGARNDRLFAAACDFQGNDIAQEDARPFLLQGCERSGYDKSFTPRQAERTIQSAYSKKRTPAKQHRSKEYKTPEWVRAAVFAQHHKWEPLKTEIYTLDKSKGRRRWQAISISAWTARKVFEACVIRAKRDTLPSFRAAQRERDTSPTSFRAAQREIAELAHIEQKTAYRALHCLQSAGYLNRISTNAMGANLFCFGKAVCQKGISTHTWYNSIDVILSKASNELHADLFSRGALGESAGRLWDAARERPFTLAQLAKRINASERTARRALKQLEAVALVHRVGKKSWVSDAADAAQLQRIAHKIENEKGRAVLGKSKRRRDKHAAQRQEFVTRSILKIKNRARASA